MLSFFVLELSSILYANRSYSSVVLVSKPGDWRSLSLCFFSCYYFSAQLQFYTEKKNIGICMIKKYLKDINKCQEEYEFKTFS